MLQHLSVFWAECLKTGKSFFSFLHISCSTRLFFIRVEMQSRCGARCFAGWSRAQHKLILFLFARLFQLMLLYVNVYLIFPHGIHSCLLTFNRLYRLIRDDRRKIMIFDSLLGHPRFIIDRVTSTDGQPISKSPFSLFSVAKFQNFITVQNVKWARHSHNQPPS